jgi:hypothetical protein
VAQQVWSEIFTDHAVQNSAQLRDELLAEKGFDFEGVLARAQAGELPEQAARTLQDAVERVFEGIDQLLIENLGHVSRVNLTEFLRQYMATELEETGFIFTLNQDMLLERLFAFGHGATAIRRPGVEKPKVAAAVGGWGVSHPNSAEPGLRVEVEALAKMPGTEWPSVRSTNNYVKLHGSWDWVSPGGTRGMVMGGGKADSINRSPLLSYYFDLFTACISGGDKRLMIIGYGFVDEHVNKALARAITNDGLRVHVWDVRPPRALREYLHTIKFGPEIWGGLCGYSQRPLSEVLGPEAKDEGGFVSIATQSMIRSVFGITRAG